MRDISGAINLDSVTPTPSSVTFSIQTASVDTGSEALDQLLRSADFLDVARFPQITFRSISIKNTTTTNVYQVVGELGLRGVTKRVALSVEVGDVTRDRTGSRRARFSVRTTLNRKDYALSWNKALDHGAVLVGDHVEVTVNLEAAGPPTAPRK